jgi:hypothetical protein
MYIEYIFENFAKWRKWSQWAHNRGDGHHPSGPATPSIHPRVKKHTFMHYQPLDHICVSSGQLIKTKAHGLNGPHSKELTYSMAPQGATPLKMVPRETLLGGDPTWQRGRLSPLVVKQPPSSSIASTSCHANKHILGTSP